MRGPVRGEKGCGEKKTSDDGTRHFLNRHGGMEQGAGMGGAGARWRSRGRGLSCQQQSRAAEVGTMAAVSLGCWAVCYGPGLVNSAVSDLFKKNLTNLNLIQSKDGLPKLKKFQMKYEIKGN
jgi:hypothetical protein